MVSWTSARALRVAGWGDEKVLELTQVTQVIGFFNHYNRPVDGLGVEDELDWVI